MKFEDVLKKSREIAAKSDISQIDFLAVQINIEGEDPGVFYVEVKDGRINVEPYEYYDRQCMITITDDDFTKLLQGKLDPKAEGDLGKALLFSDLLQNKIGK